MLIHETTKAGTGMGVLLSLLSHSALVVSVIYFVHPTIPDPLPLGLDGVEIAWLPPKGEMPQGVTLAAATETTDETDAEPLEVEEPPVETAAEEPEEKPSIAEATTTTEESASVVAAPAETTETESETAIATEAAPEPEPVTAEANEPAPAPVAIEANDPAPVAADVSEPAPEANAFLTDPESEIPVDSSSQTTQETSTADSEVIGEDPSAVPSDLPAKQFVKEPTPIPADAQTAVETAPGTKPDAAAPTNTANSSVQGTFHEDASEPAPSATDEQLKELAQETGEPEDVGTAWGRASQEDVGSPTGVIRDASSLRQIPGNRPPDYPARDRLQKIEGIVVLLAYVTPDGRVEKVQIERAAPSERMNSNSVRAFAKYRFQPGQQGWVRQPYVFRLNGSMEQVPARLGSRRRLQ